MSWTPVIASMPLTGLSLSYGTTYYLSATAENGAGLVSTVATSEGITLLDPALDLDGDGLTADQEVNSLGTHPLQRDTDGDGFGDGFELHWGADPLAAASVPTAKPLPFFTDFEPVVPGGPIPSAMFLPAGVWEAAPRRRISPASSG